MPGLDYAAAELEYVARQCRLAAAGGLVRELQNAITDATRPVLAEIREGIPAHMPRRGGYAATLSADLRLSTSKRLTGTTAGVTLVGQTRSGRGRKLRQLDAGRLTHPLFGDRQQWYTQTAGVRAGFFTGPAESSAPQVRDAILAAIDKTGREVMP